MAADLFISSIQEIEKCYSEFPKSLRIRIERWVEKLVNSGSNPAFTAHRNAYTKLLLSMVRNARFLEPFHRMPPDGRLAPFPTHLRSSIRNVEAPAPAQEGANSASDDGFWGDMRSRAAGMYNLNSSHNSYIHTAPVAATVHELAEEELERAHSNTLAYAPPKKAVALSPVRSPHRASRDSRGYSPEPPSPPPLDPDSIRPSYAELLQSHQKAGSKPAHPNPTDFRKNVQNFQPPWNTRHKEEAEQQTSDAAAFKEVAPQHRTLHAPAASHTPIRAANGGSRAAAQSQAHDIHHVNHTQKQHKTAATAAHAKQDADTTAASPSRSVFGMSRFLNLSNDQLENHKQHKEANSHHQYKEVDYGAHDLPVLHSLLREQNLRIQILEERLMLERTEHARQVQHIEYSYASELTRLREVEANANLLHEQQSRREMDIIEMHHQNSNTGTSYYSNNNSLRNSGTGLPPGAGYMNQSSTSSNATNLDNGREYVSMEFDRAYGGVVSASIGDGWEAIPHHQQQRQPNRSMLPDSPEASRHHLIHISSPPPRLPGRTSPIPMAAGTSTNTGGGSRQGLALPGQIQFPENDSQGRSMLGRSFAQQSQRWVNDSLSHSQGEFLHPTSAAAPAPPALQRDISDKEDADFLAYLSAFQEEIRQPGNPFRSA